MKKILITTYFFPPEITPRAFRAFELAKEFSRRGYSVDVVVPDRPYNYEKMEKEFGINIFRVKTGFLFNKNAKEEYEIKCAKGKSRFLVRLFKLFYIGGKSFEYALTLCSFLRKEMFKRGKYDYVISIGLPFSVHIGTSFFLKENTVSIKIADYGDPFSYNRELDGYFYYKLIEKKVLNNFNYIVVPIFEAREKFEYFKNSNCIKVIPQGMDFSEVKLKKYERKLCPTFAYAGVFYEKIRNPKVLFEFLLKLDIDFRFVIFTDVYNTNNMKLINSYFAKLSDKVVIKPLIPRLECIYELSDMDFLINQNNSYEEQKPSKLIDYGATGRPVFNYSQDAFDEFRFYKFLNYEFPDDAYINIDDYKVEYTLDKFINIVNMD